MSKHRWLAWALVIGGALLLASCAEGGTTAPGGDAGRRDGGALDGAPEDASDASRPDGSAGSCTRDEDCPDDGIFCNGGLSCIAGRCAATAVPSCDDGITCTLDSCSPSMDRCVNTPNDSLCPDGTRCYTGIGCADAPPCEFDADCRDDGIFCNGPETCVGGRCRSAGLRECDDANSCTIDECSDDAGACVQTPYADMLTNVTHCGTGSNDCVVCPAPPATNHQVAICAAGACGVECEMGYIDGDGNPANGCEYRCTASGGIDVPDDGFSDSNCDGIDGDRARAVFVSSRGSDSNDGLTTTTPVATFARALIVATTSGRSQVLVATATYNMSTTLSLSSGVSFYGGYSDDFASRTDTRAILSSTAATAVRAEGLTSPVTIDRVNLTTTDRSGTSSASTMTLLVRGSSDHLTLRWVNVLAGRGGEGAPGAAGTAGASGTRGSDGVNESGGAGGSLGGGRGTSGRYRAEGLAGSPGSSGSCGYGGSGGAGSGSSGLGCSDGDPRPGGNGGPGCNASGTGPHGSSGSGLGTMSAEAAWSPSRGGAGSTGGVGGGGGGGGAGGGENCDYVLGSYFGTGRGGGGGGGGGSGGGGGQGGLGGGASIGIVLIDSTISVHQTRVQTAGGGTGGAGGAGGPGGSGGPGGTGAPITSDTQGAGGNGGAGGSGSPGGCGGGGAGGPSVGVWGTGTSSVFREITPLIFSIGSGGGGGTSCGNNGSSGVQQNTVQAFPG